MKLLICPNYKSKNFYVGRQKNPCVRCGTIIESDKCESITIVKEPFTEYPLCGTKYDLPVTKCTAKNKKWKSICGFDYRAIDDAEEIAKMNEEKERKQEELLSQQPLQPQNIPKCPTCGSTNIRKISTTRKVAGAMGFGFLSKTAKSQFECKNCGYKW